MTRLSTDEDSEEHKGEIEGYEQPSPGGWDGYPIDALSIRDERRTAVDVVRRISTGRFVIDPEFERGFVWDKTKQSRLIESILMRIPLPVFYVAEDRDGKLIVVDGRQRLTTLKRFFDGDLVLDLRDRRELHGKKFKDIEYRLQNRAEDCQLYFFIIDYQAPERARLDIFERVNGGEVLTRQQMRNAIHSGPGTRFLRDEAATLLFREATGNSLDEKKMQDREFVNRFCSFEMLPLDSYKGDMDDWLGRGLKSLGQLQEADRQCVSVKFRRGLANNLAVFGKHSFRKIRSSDQRRNPINAAIFDVMMHTLCCVDEAILGECRSAFYDAFNELLSNDEFYSLISSGRSTTMEVRRRFEIAGAKLKEVLSAAVFTH